MIRANDPRLLARRKDGWPLCPNCGEDEVFTLAHKILEQLPSGFLTAPIGGCYRCNWDPLRDGIPAQRVCIQCGTSCPKLPEVCEMCGNREILTQPAVSARELE